MMIAFMVVPLIVIAVLAALAVGLWLPRFRDLPLDGLGGQRIVHLALVLSLVGAGAVAAWRLYAIFTSTSSTAPHGLAFLPLYAAGAGLATLALIWAGAVLLAGHTGLRRLLDAPDPSWRRALPAALLLAAAATVGFYHLDRARQLAAAGQSVMPTAMLQALTGEAIAERDYELLAALAENVTLDRQSMVRIFEHCTPDLDQAGPSPCAETFRGLAANPTAPEAVLARLADYAAPAVRSAVGYNPATPPEVLARLAKDPDWLVRGSVLGNAALPLAELEGLAGDPNDTVRRNATATLARRRPATETASPDRGPD